MSKDYTVDRVPMNEEEEEFAALFSEDTTPAPARRLTKGEMVTGKLISVGIEVAFVDLGGKAEGIIDSAELQDLDVKPGDDIEAMVLSTSGEIRLSRTLAGIARDKELLRDAYDMGLPVEGRIEARNKGGYDVSIGQQRAFLPVSHLDINSVEDLDAWIGRTERFKIIEFDDQGKRTVVSRSQLLRQERDQLKEATWDTLEVGQIKKGTVRSIQDYGCFVDIGGVDGLVHIKEMQWSRLAHPSDLVSVGEEVTVTVSSIDTEKGRVGLTMKMADGDPWKQVGTEVQAGNQYDGEVTRVEKYGAFVEILPGMEGLVHVSELTFLKRVRHANEVVSVGDRVTVTIMEVNAIQQRISLSMKQLEGDPWSDVAENFAIGTTVAATVQRTAGFGVFLDVAPGVTGLLPRSETNQPQGADLGRFYKQGDVLNVVIISVDVDERRMTLSLSALEDAAEAANMAEYQKSKSSNQANGFGTFADLLKNVKVD